MATLIGNTKARSLYWKSRSNNIFPEKVIIIRLTHKPCNPEVKGMQ